MQIYITDMTLLNTPTSGCVNYSSTRKHSGKIWNLGSKILCLLLIITHTTLITENIIKYVSNLANYHTSCNMLCIKYFMHT